jgi:hypothetical protein
MATASVNTNSVAIKHRPSLSITSDLDGSCGTSSCGLMSPAPLGGTPLGGSYRWNPYSATAASTTAVACADGATPQPWDDATAASDAGTALHESIHELTSDASTDASTAGDADEASALVLKRLTAVRRDSAVAAIIRAQPAAVIAAVEACAAAQPDLLLDLCARNRGNVLVALFKRGCGAPLFAAVLKLLPHLTADRACCFGLTQIHEAASAGQRAALDHYVAANVASLAVHPFANYLVSRSIEGRSAACADVMGHQLADPRVFAELATTKTGSAVLEKFLKLSHDAAVLPVITGALAANEQLTRAACDRFGNFVVQAIVRRLFAMRGAMAVGAQHCAAHAVTQATDFSVHRINIRNGLATAAASVGLTYDPGQRTRSSIQCRSDEAMKLAALYRRSD